MKVFYVTDVDFVAAWTTCKDPRGEENTTYLDTSFRRESCSRIDNCAYQEVW
jgi:hypothetical protein